MFSIGIFDRFRVSFLAGCIAIRAVIWGINENNTRPVFLFRDFFLLNVIYGFQLMLK